MRSKNIIINIIVIIFIIMLMSAANAKDSYYGFGYSVEYPIHGYVGTVEYAGHPDHTKFTFHAQNNKYEIVNVTTAKDNIDILRFFSGKLEEITNSDGFELIEGESYGLEFSSNRPFNSGGSGSGLYWGYFTGVKLYKWDALVYDNAFSGNHWVIPGGLDIGFCGPISSTFISLGAKVSFAFGMMKMDNETTGESYSKIAFGYEHQFYTTLTMKF